MKQTKTKGNSNNKGKGNNRSNSKSRKNNGEVVVKATVENPLIAIRPR